MPKTHVTRLIGLCIIFILIVSLGPAYAFSASQSASDFDSIPGQNVELRDSGMSEISRVSSSVSTRSAQSAVFTVTYDAGFDANPSAKAAFQAAIDIWSRQITSTVPITVDAKFRSDLGTNVLGSAGASRYYRNFTNAPVTNTYYPVATASALAGRNLNATNGAGAMINSVFSSTADWYFGTDGNTPSTQSDFESVVLHEIGHGLGFAGTGDNNGLTSTIGFLVTSTTGATYVPSIFDLNVANGGGTSAWSQSTNGLALTTMFLSNGLYWSGPNGVTQAGGMRPRLYAPSIWEDGSSFSHLDETTYPRGTGNSLMTPIINRGESVHDPGPIARGMLMDMGWNATTSVPATATAVATATPVSTATATPDNRTPVVTSANPTVVAAVPTVAPGMHRSYMSVVVRPNPS